jgi:1-aminocyclopropane-1-carboxylate deaminase
MISEDGLALNLPSEIQDITGKFSSKRPLFIKRDDQIHPWISGNKWRKLQGHLEHALNQDYDVWISFGDAYSNHLVATACTCYHLKIPFVAVIRGEDMSNPTLRLFKEFGATLYFVDRSSYRLKENGAEILKLLSNYKNPFIIPEGGNSSFAETGLKNLAKELSSHLFPTQQKYLCVALGTGATATYLAKHLGSDWHIRIYPVLKGLNLDFEKQANISINEDAHLGGYARWDENLLQSMRTFTGATQIKLDPIYTGKLWHGIEKDLENNFFEAESSIVLYHSGGLQGLAGFEERTGLQVYPTSVSFPNIRPERSY